MKRMSHKRPPKVHSSTDYRKFVNVTRNRPTDLRQHKNLEESYAENGSMPEFPCIVTRLPDGRFEINDGQHRAALAEKYGLPIYYIITDKKLDIAKINNTQKVWRYSDYAQSYANQGKEEYEQIISFAGQYGIPIGVAAGLLSGTISPHNCRDSYLSGNFKIKDRETAAVVASLYSQLVTLNKKIKNVRLLQAIYACARIPGFDPNRIIAGGNRCFEKLQSYSTREAYLAMLEELYNYGRRIAFPLKVNAENAMKERNAVLTN